MAKIVLIHGFAVHLTVPIIRPPFGPAACFKVFEKKVEDGEAKVFQWGIKKQVSPVRLLDPFFWIKHYQSEKAIATSSATLERLQDFLEQEKPEIIICHSMGCYLLNNFCKNFSLPDSVKKIIFVQADTSALSASYAPSAPLHNFFCPWDPTLLISMIFNREKRVGLFSSSKADKNIFWPLFLPINLHTSTIRDKRFLEFVEFFSSTSITENGFTPSQEGELVKISDETLKQFKAGKIKGYKSAKSLFDK